MAGTGKSRRTAIAKRVTGAEEESEAEIDDRDAVSEEMSGDGISDNEDY